ncbi:alpha/beta hydrolase [Actinoplanes sp. NPDC051470]|uniref:alpha/beta hydrolase n=1 Tax=unclassified Actinoplanes TaxID=2626549 RepID=UPI0034153B84
MPVAQPGGDLWPQVVAEMQADRRPAWPQADEDAMRELSATWRGQGDAFIRTAGFSLAEVEQSWIDDVGKAYLTRAGGHLGTVGRTGSEMVELGRRADAYASTVSSVKLAIKNLMERNELLYQGELPARRAAFVTAVAGEVDRLMQGGAEQITGSAGAPLGRAELPPPGAAPGDIRAWWQTQPDATQDALKRENPDAIRNLDGIPAAVRDETNRSVLDREIGALQTRLDEVRDTPPLRRDGDPREIHDLQERIDGLKLLRENPGGERLLLGLDTSGRGQAIVAIGNPDNAVNVSTVVPGVDTRLGTIDGEIGRAERLRAAAGEVSADPAVAAQTSVIAWVGYDTPTIDGAIWAAPAEAAAPALDRFQDGLRATHNGAAAHQTVIAHSYGTVVAGIAAHGDGLNADDLVLVASPGIPVDHVSELNLDGVREGYEGQHVYAITSPDDWIQGPAAQTFGGDHGADPADPLESWGAQILHDDNGNRDDEHNAYFDEGTASLRRLGGLII